MGLIASTWASSIQANASPLDDSAFTIGGGSTWTTWADRGNVAENAAKRVAAVFLCQKILGEAMAQLPCILYERLPALSDGTTDKMRSDDPLAPVLDEQSNDEQTSFEFIEQMQGWASFRRFAYAEKMYRSDGVVEQLIPRHPDRVRIDRLADGQKRYSYLEDDGVKRRNILAEDMFSVPGTPVLQYAAQSFGIAQSLQNAALTTFANGIHPSGFIATDPGQEWTEAGKNKVIDSIKNTHGNGRTGGVLWLPDGLKWNQLGMTFADAEFVAFSTATVEDIGRWWRIPPYMLNVTVPGSMSHASLESQSIEFVVYTLMPWVRRWEQAIKRDLIMDKRNQFAEFLMSALMRGTTAERFAAYSQAIQWGWMSPNDVRRLENMNARPGGESYLTPLNMSPSSSPAAALREGGPQAKLLRLMVGDGAGRILRKEASALARLAERHADDAGAFEAAAAAFYGSHASDVASILHLPAGAAVAYTESQRLRLLSAGPSALASWEAPERQDYLTELTFAEAA